MKKNHQGFFISFEGGEKLGKSTQAQGLAENLRGMGHDVILTREPGGTEVGERIRELLLNPAWSLSKATEMLLYQADRAQHYKEVLKPALRAGKIVISDRYVDSSIVYQGCGLGWNIALLYRLHNATTGMLFPDLTFILTGAALSKRRVTDTVEKRDDFYHDKVRAGYAQLVGSNPRFVAVDANRTREDVLAEITKIALSRLCR